MFLLILLIGINFSMPYSVQEEVSPSSNPEEEVLKVTLSPGKELDSDEEPEKWLEEMGISQDFCVINAKR
jgi:hypothetical protein